MQLKNSFAIFAVLFAIQACHAQQQTLKCFVCENCAKVTKETPLLACNEDFFNDVATTLPTSGTTTAAAETTTTAGTVSTTESSTKEDSTTTTTTTTTSTTTTTTAEPTTTTPETTETHSTDTTRPAPPTIAPTATTPTVPTPPNVGTDTVILDQIHLANGTLLGNSTTPNTTRAYMVSSDFRARSRRATVNSTGVSYHCYRAQQKNANGTLETIRGCSRVTAEQGVCPQLKLNRTLNSCYACTMPHCNGSSALNASILTIIVGVVVAALLKGF